jgi:hypothetical protein
VIHRHFRARIFLTAVCLAFAAALTSAQKVQLAPRLRAGQTFFYRIDFSSSRSMRTESRVASPQLPPAESVNASGLLQVGVVEATASGYRVKTYYSERNPAGAGQASGPQSRSAPAADKVIEVSIAANGTASQVKGLDQLSLAQQLGWNDWLARFAASMTFPKGGVGAGQKWEAVEPETTPSPIAGLSWRKKYQYVRDEPCRFSGPPAKSSQGRSSPDVQPCAVILVHSNLRQASSSKNATPEDYKLRDLRTRGTATGQNETILYLSRATGLLIRSTEDALQSMDVIVAVADGSNQVHYNLDAKSHSEILLLPDSPQGPQ